MLFCHHCCLSASYLIPISSRFLFSFFLHLIIYYHHENQSHVVFLFSSRYLIPVSGYHTFQWTWVGFAMMLDLNELHTYTGPGRSEPEWTRCSDQLVEKYGLQLCEWQALFCHHFACPWFLYLFFLHLIIMMRISHVVFLYDKYDCE